MGDVEQARSIIADVQAKVKRQEEDDEKKEEHKQLASTLSTVPEDIFVETSEDEDEPVKKKKAKVLPDAVDIADDDSDSDEDEENEDEEVTAARAVLARDNTLKAACLPALDDDDSSDNTREAREATRRMIRGRTGGKKGEVIYGGSDKPESEAVPV